MSEEQDYVIITIEDDSDADDDVDIVIIEESDTEDTENTFSTDEILTVETDFQDDSDNSQQPSHLSYEVEDLAVLGDQAVSQMNRLATLKRYSPNSAEVEFIPLPKKGRLSVPGEDNMESNASEVFFNENHRNQLMEFQHHCQSLQELTENMKRQVNHLCGIVSQMQHSLEKSLLLNCGDCSPSLPEQRQESGDGTNPVGPSLQSAALPELQQPVLMESPPLPRIVSTFSLQPCTTPSSPFPVLAIPSYFFSEGTESTNGVISSAEAAPAVPAAVLPQGEPSLADTAGTMNYSTIMENNSVGADTALPSLCIPPNFEMPGKAATGLGNSTKSMHYPTFLGSDSGQDTTSSSVFSPPNFALPEIAETSLENSPETMCYPTLSGSDSGQYSSSSVSLPPNFTAEKFILIEMPGKAETSLDNSSQTMYCPSLLGNNNGPETDSSFHSLSPKFALEKVILIEMPGKADTSMENSSQTMYYPALVGNGSGPDAASSRLSIPPNFEMFLKAETSMENNPQMMNYLPFLEDGCAQETSYFFIPPGFESSTEMKSETTNYPTVMENDSGQDIDSETFFLTHGFALLPIEILVKAENCVENDPETMNDSTVLENVNSQDSSSSSFCIPSNFGYLGDPKRNVRMLDIHLMTTQKKATPKHAACYLISILFSKEMLMSSSVGVTSQGRQPLDPNKMAAIREHLAAIFPNHDLRECGKDWQACISDITSLIGHLCSEAKRTPKTVDNNKEPPNRDAPKCADSHDKRDGDGGSQLPRRAAFSETGENENSQQNSSVLPEEIKQLSTNNSTVSYETLEYFGNPWRNIWMPKSVLNTAKKKSRPELSARYLIQNLFTEEVLIKSNIFGSLGRGMCACSANKINALRETSFMTSVSENTLLETPTNLGSSLQSIESFAEFLQDIYPTCDLSETGYDWKLCVTAINSCIRSLRYDFKKSTSKSQPPPAATLSTESEPRDTDLAD